MSKKLTIAIDGPAAAGKSTIARAAARKLGFVYVDTGAMYRAIALYLIRNEVDVDNLDCLKKALSEINIRIVYSNGEQQILLNNENVTAYLLGSLARYTFTASPLAKVM